MNNIEYKKELPCPHCARMINIASFSGRIEAMREKAIKQFTLGQKCAKCNKILEQEDVDNSLWAIAYHLCRECASKISV
jgi:DNA-directed RNA polymerase subunit RPC12/RpoP